jgi:hypothetical protein
MNLATNCLGMVHEQTARLSCITALLVQASVLLKATPDIVSSSGTIRINDDQGTYLISSSSNSSRPIPFMSHVSEIDVNVATPDALFWLRVFPSGRASLSRNSQWIDDSAPGTFDFLRLYKEMAALPVRGNYHSSFRYDVQFLEYDQQYQNPSTRMIGPAIARPLFETFERFASTGKARLQKLFSQSPPFPPKNS